MIDTGTTLQGGFERSPVQTAIAAIRANRHTRTETLMTMHAEQIANRLAPLVQGGVIRGHTLRAVSAIGRVLVKVSASPGAPKGIGDARAQVVRALYDLDAVILEFSA